MSEDRSMSGDGDLQRQMADMQKLMELQLKTISAQAELFAKSQAEAQVPHSTLANSSQMVRNVKVPEGHYTMSLSEYRTFRKDCIDFRKLTQYSDEQIVLQLRMNMDADLKRAIDTNFRDEWNAYTVEAAVEKIGEIVNHVSNSAVYRKQFDEMNQKGNESIREYVTRLKACAVDCNFICPYDELHDLSDYHIINRIRSGVCNEILQQELLQKSNTVNTLALITQYCGNYESAKKDRTLLSQNDADLSLCGIETEGLTQGDIVAAISNYKKSKSGDYRSTKYLQNKRYCTNCGYEKQGKHACPASGKDCKKCGEKNHFAKVCPNSKKSHDKQISAFIIGTIEKIIGPCSIGHMEYLPKLLLYFRTPYGDSEIECIADTGAQVTVGGVKQMEMLGIREEQLLNPSCMLKHAGGSHLNVIGSCTATIEHHSKSIDIDIYFAPEVSNLYLSLDVCKQLHLVHKEFPHIDVSIAANASEALSLRPTLPFNPCDANIPLLEQWLLDKFSSTAFNTSAYPLPLMKGKAQHFHLLDNAEPYAAHTPIPIPHHWKAAVKNQLDRDVEMGIIQKAPVGEPTEWCMRMITVPKKDGTPRRTIDFQPINKYCSRETHHTPTPFQVVSNVPPRTYKSTVDAYNGYHQVPLDEKSIKLTTFITEFGRYQYLRSPQGHVASGDAYTRRYDDIITDVPRKQKIVDDVLLHSDTIEEAFYQMFDYLTLCSENGITLNPTKFMFARKEVEFAGYNIGWEKYRPTDDMLSAIANFPMPEDPSISDIRSWFGLVNQLAPFIATSPIMDPFRDLLKPTNAIGKKIYWDSQLQQLFEETKLTIINQAIKGLTYYDTSKETAVITDWSKQGIGFVILQKHCICEIDEDNPICCTEWKMVFCNSRHLTAAEQNYAPIEGEALAVTWALKKARLFLLGNKFRIVVDHQPLLKILNDKSLADISNHRLLRLKEKTMQFSFTIHHVKGIRNIADVLSRYPVNNPDIDDISFAETIEIATIDIINKIGKYVSITHDAMQTAILQDAQYQKVLSAVKENTFGESSCLELPELKEFYNVRERLSIVNDNLMYAYEEKELRLVIPKKLRQQVITNLHAANQGTTSMLARARHVVYWPGMDRDFDIHMSRCRLCKENSPSYQKEPIILSPVPEYPFQHTVADLFEIDGHKYLVYADRLTGFPELAHFPTSATSLVIMNTFREFFHRWGVPEEVSLDGGPNLKSKEITDWLDTWGVTYRRSSAYYPQSNGRAEAAVKSLKRLLRGNTGRQGTINTDEVAYALLQYRNTPLRNIDKSPAQLALGRQLKDTLPLPRSRYAVDINWMMHLKNREKCMSKANDIVKIAYNKGTKQLPELQVGTPVVCQDPRNLRWNRSGIIVDVGEHRQYHVKMDGSGRLTLRNRRHLKPILVDRPFVPLLHKSDAPTRSVDQSDIPRITIDDKPHVDSQQLQVDTQSQHMVPLDVPPRRSNRTHRKPLRYIEE